MIRTVVYLLGALGFLLYLSRLHPPAADELRARCSELAGPAERHECNVALDAIEELLQGPTR